MFYKKLDFPSIPDNIIDSLESSLSDIDAISVPDIGGGIQHFKNNKKLTACSYNLRHIENNKLEIWLKENIPNIDARYNMLYQTQEPRGASSTHIVHSDARGRKSALNYIIEPGGDNVVSSWYKENGKELHRGKKDPWRQSDSGFVDYANLELLVSTTLEKGCWYVIDTRVLHDVDNITRTRKGISISFADRSYLIE